MATLITDTTQLQQYASTAFNFNFSNLEPYVRQAERQFIKPLIGAALYTSWTTTPPKTGNTKIVYELVCEASANLSILKYMPSAIVTISDNGILVTDNPNTKTAEWWQIRDLKRSLIDIGFSALDEALATMETNETDFSDWVNTEGYTNFKELVTPKTSSFQRWFNIHNSRRTFLALRPYLLETQTKIFNWLGADTLALIKAPTTAVQKQATDYAQAAHVSHTVALAATSGMFWFTETGFFAKSVELPGDKTSKLEQEEIYRLIESRKTSGDEYLKRLQTLVTDNPDEFPNYVNPDNNVKIFVHNTKSIVAF